MPHYDDDAITRCMAEPTINGVLESILYAPDLVPIRSFYSQVLGLNEVSYEPGRHVFFRCGAGMLLIFNPESTRDTDVQVGDAYIPRHGTTGPGHLAFSIDVDAMQSWHRRLESHAVEIESEVVWYADRPHVRSLYFRDPANNSIEIACPELWSLGE